MISLDMRTRPRSSSHCAFRLRPKVVWMPLEISANLDNTSNINSKEKITSYKRLILR